MGRPLRTHLELLKPDLAGKVRCSQTSKQKMARERSKQKMARDGRSKQRVFSPSETVYIRKSDKESQWIPGIVESKLGDYTYLIRLDNNQTVRRHIDHIRSGFHEVVPDKNDNDLPDFSFKDNSCDDTPPIVATAGLRRSNRVSNPPDRWMYGLH